MRYVRNLTLFTQNNKQGCPKYANIFSGPVTKLNSQFMASFLHRFNSMASNKSIVALFNAKYESLTQIIFY